MKRYDVNVKKPKPNEDILFWQPFSLTTFWGWFSTAGEFYAYTPKITHCSNGEEFYYNSITESVIIPDVRYWARLPKNIGGA